MLHDLARMNLNGINGAPAAVQLAQPALSPAPAARTVLGEKGNLAPAPAAVQPKKAAAAIDMIVISSDEEGEGTAARSGRHTKAARLLKLARQTGAAVDNESLARLVHAFRDAVTSGGRTLTKEGFVFLDGLHKQLADRDILLVPLRTSQQARRTARTEDSHLREVTVEERRSRLWQLRTDVAHAQDNRALGKLVADFGTMIDRSAGRRLTNDGLAFLDGIEERLRTLND
jgi:casein kinase 1